MKQKKEMTTMWVRRKDKAWVDKQRRRLSKRGAGNILQSMIQLIKLHKMENELK